MPALTTDLIPQRDLDVLFTVPEVAGKLKMSDKTIRKKVTAGEIKHIRVGRQYRILGSAVNEYLATFTASLEGR